MGHDEQYDLWRRRRAQIEVPGDFADRVMASVRRQRQFALRFLLLRLAANAARSRILRVGAFALGVAVSLAQIGSILAIFVPSTL
jgi:hypothetical protein